MLRKVDKNLESFMESTQEAPKKLKSKPDKSFILNEFPLKNLENLHAMERKLKQDVIFKSELVRYFFI